jgi:hypothetical protein
MQKEIESPEFLRTKLEEEVFGPPSQRHLESKALQHLMDVGEYRSMTKTERAEYYRIRSETARSDAENLIWAGASNVEAWNRAVRLEILGSESD